MSALHLLLALAAVQKLIQDVPHRHSMMTQYHAHSLNTASGNPTPLFSPTPSPA